MNPTHRPKFTTADYEEMHRRYAFLTGMDTAFIWQRHEMMWLQWHDCGFTMDDLALVAKYLRGQIANRVRFLASLRFERLIGDTGAFADHLAEAKAALGLNKKPRPNPARESVLKATGRESDTAKVRTPEQVMAEQKFIEQCKRENGL